VFLLLSPHYLDYSLYFILKVYLLPRRHVNINPTRQAINILPVVYELWGRDNVGELSYLYLSLSLIDKDKNVRLIASDLWVKAISEGNLDSRLLGLTLGKLEAIPYAPIKRFTDLIIASMLNISSLHNQSLYSILSSMIPQMNDEPINGHKKFLEIYMEVLSLTQQQAPQDVLEKLGVWGEVKSLSAIVKKIGM